jgi:hypothetical protein
MGAPCRSYRLVAAYLPAVAACLLLDAGLAAQGPNSALPAPAAAATSLASMDAQAREVFLSTAKIVNVKSPPKGTTNTKRVTLSDGALSHDASVQTIDDAKAVFESNLGTELNFKDSWRFNVAAYQIDRLLAINMIPATVERRYDGKPGSFTWWVDEVLMDEQERYRQKKSVPDTIDWNRQMWITRMFDQLIANVDRNLGNLLIDKSYNIWMIDHSRAFRINKDLRAPGNLSGMDRSILDHLRKLTRESVKAAVGDRLMDIEIDAMLSRRDKIVAHYDQGPPALLFDRRPR